MRPSQPMSWPLLARARRRRGPSGRSFRRSPLALSALPGATTWGTPYSEASSKSDATPGICKTGSPLTVVPKVNRVTNAARCELAMSRASLNSSQIWLMSVPSARVRRTSAEALYPRVISIPLSRVCGYGCCTPVPSRPCGVWRRVLLAALVPSRLGRCPVTGCWASRPSGCQALA